MSEVGQTIAPSTVRNALQKINMGTMIGDDFLEGNMGCAQETFEAILCYLHREYIYPNYLQEYVEANREKKFELDNKLDDMGCTPKCASHQTFGLQTIDLTSCAKCDFVDDINEVHHAFIQQFYVEELFHVNKSVAAKQKKLPILMSKIMKNESDFHIEHREKKICRKCTVPVKIEQKWLLELPSIYTIGL